MSGRNVPWGYVAGPRQTKMKITVSLELRRAKTCWTREELVKTAGPGWGRKARSRETATAGAHQGAGGGSGALGGSGASRMGVRLTDRSAGTARGPGWKGAQEPGRQPGGGGVRSGRQAAPRVSESRLFCKHVGGVRASTKRTWSCRSGGGTGPRQGSRPVRQGSGQCGSVHS